MHAISHARNHAHACMPIWMREYACIRYVQVWHNYAFDRHVLFNHGVDVKGFGGTASAIFVVVVVAAVVVVVVVVVVVAAAAVVVVVVVVVVVAIAVVARASEAQPAPH